MRKCRIHTKIGRVYTIARKLNYFFTFARGTDYTGNKGIRVLIEIENAEGDTWRFYVFRRSKENAIKALEI
jgi:hypothetical protein